MTSYLLVTAVSLMALLAVYYGVKRFYPTFGTVAMNVFTLAATAAEPLSGVLNAVASFAGELPWATVIGSDGAAKIGFAVATANAIANAIARRGAKKPIMSS
jgi:hypothetical protein